MKKPGPLLVIFLIVFFDLLSFGIVIPILPFYAKTYGASAYVWAWVMAIYSIAQFVFAPVWGSLSDRLGRRPILLGSIAFGALATGLLGFADSITTIFLCRMFAGIFAANIATANAYIADSTDESNRAKGMGIIGAGFGLGFIFGPAVGSLLSQYGYATPFFFAAGLGLFNLVLGIILLPEPLSDQNQRKANRRKFSFAFLRAALANPATFMPIALFFLSTLAFVQLEVSFAYFVLARFGYGAYEAGLLLAMMGVVMVLVQGGLIGRIVKRLGEANTALLGMLCMALGTFASVYFQSLAPFCVALVTIALGNGLVHPSLTSLMSKAAPKESQGGMMGIFQSSSSLARIIGPPVAGALFDRVGIASPLLLASAIVAFAFLLGLLFVRKPSLA